MPDAIDEVVFDFPAQLMNKRQAQVVPRIKSKAEKEKETQAAPQKSNESHIRRFVPNKHLYLYPSPPHSPRVTQRAHLFFFSSSDALGLLVLAHMRMQPPTTLHRDSTPFGQLRWRGCSPNDQDWDYDGSVLEA